MWTSGSLIVDLYAPVDPREVGPARLRGGTLFLPMRKMRAETWPSFEHDVIAFRDEGDEEDAFGECQWGGCVVCPM